MTKETDENLNFPKDKVIKWCAVLLSGVVPIFAPESSKSSLSSNQILLKLCSDATGAADKPDHGWMLEQRRCTFEALSPYWWHDSEIKEIKRSLASGSIELAGSSCYNPSPSQKHSITAPLHPNHICAWSRPKGLVTSVFKPSIYCPGLEVDLLSSGKLLPQGAFPCCLTLENWCLFGARHYCAVMQ